MAKKGTEEKKAKLRIFYKNIDDLIDANYNPRKHTQKQKEDLKESLDEFGLVDPLIVNIHPERKNIIVGGHFRKDNLKEMGYTHVPCILVNLPLKKERELNIRLNKNTGDWDDVLLEQNYTRQQLLDYGFEMYELPAGLEDIDELDNDGYGGFSGYINKNTNEFAATFVFPVKFKETYDRYIDKYDKQQLTEKITELIQGMVDELVEDDNPSTGA